MGEKRLDLVSHFHWDPAWYLPFEQYRILLVELMDDLLKLLDTEKEYKSFMFDGQVSAMEDYLEIRPEMEESLKKHIKNGRLIIGPWYIQPELFMISGETHIRNLILGHKVAKRFGEPMKVSYLCDMVGHPAQMPQIVNGFGIFNYAGARGILDNDKIKNSEFIWKAPDGSEVLFKVMPNGYSHSIPDDFDGFCEYIDKMESIITPFKVAEDILIMQGGDHKKATHNTPALIKEYNRRAGYEKISQTSYFTHMNKIKAVKNKLVTYGSELRNMYYNYILTGILSTRIGIKLENEHCTREIERWLEPFSAFFALEGGKYNVEFIDYVWKKQIRNSFHDHIYGAHVDSVTADIMSDYKRELEVCDWITRENLFGITEKINTNGKSVNVTIFNSSFNDRINETAEIEFFLYEDKAITEFIVYNADGREISSQLLGYKKEPRYWGNSGNFKQQSATKWGIKYKMAVKVPLIPAMGYVNIELKKAKATPENFGGEYVIYNAENKKITDIYATASFCENSFYRIDFNDNGSLNIYDKKSDIKYDGFHMFEDTLDEGDQYNFSEPFHSNKTTSLTNIKINLIENGAVRVIFKIEGEMEQYKSILHSEGTGEKEMNKITTLVTLSSASPIISFKTTIKNNTKDHRIRVIFKTNIKSEYSYAGDHFYVNKRKTFDLNEVKNNIEQPQGNYPHRLFVSVHNAKQGLSVFDRGIPEYFADDKGNLALTLLRCVGFLSKDDCAVRSHAAAGPVLETPLSQEIGEHSFEYAVVLHKGDWKTEGIYKLCDDYYLPIKSMQGEGHFGEYPAIQSFLSVDNELIRFSAFKKSEGGWLLRLYNISDIKQKAVISLFKTILSASETDMLEKDISELTPNGKTLDIEVEPHKIYNIKLVF